MENSKKDKKVLTSIILLLIGLILVVAISYAWLTKTIYGEKIQSIVVGSLRLTLNEGESLTLENSVPITDDEGLEQAGFSFSLKNTGVSYASYSVYLDDDSIEAGKTRLPDEYIKYSLEKNGVKEETKTLTNRMIYQGGISARKSDSFILRTWIDSSKDGYITGNVFKVKLRVEASQSKDPLLTKRLLADATNPSSIKTYNDGDKSKMYTFKQKAREQQVGYTAEELTEYRYIGNVPNNYIRFNDEMWRIIGVFTVEDKDGKKAQRVKIMRDESIGGYSWDNTNIENEYGKNRWSDARLNYLLNPGHESESIGGSLYWNRKSGTCYYEQNNVTTECDFTGTGLTSDAKNKISAVKWYLGGYDWTGTHSVELFYEKERGTSVFSSTSYPRETNWIGHVGLIYPSDYGYTYSLGIDNACYNNTYNCTTTLGGIPTTGWMFNNSIFQWTLSSRSTHSYDVISVSSLGYIYTNYAFRMNGVRPVVYLKPDVKLSSGSGTSSDPFQISM